MHQESSVEHRGAHHSLWTTAARAAALVAIVGISFAAASLADQQTEGAVRTLDNKPKSALAPVYDLAASCSLAADDLDCSGSLPCGTNLEVPCGTVAGGLDHIAVGTGLRNSGRGTLALRGAPTGAEPVAAWLYWGSILLDAHDPRARKVTFAGSDLDGDLLATAPEPCWARNSVFAAFRASVLHLLAPTINGEYDIEIPISSSRQGEDPWGLETIRPPYTDGASLLVVFAHPSIPRHAQFYLHDVVARLDENPLVIHHQLDPLPPLASQLRHTRLGADGQRHANGEPTAPIRTSFQTEVIPWQIIRGPGSLLDPSPAWLGADGGPFDQLWDTEVTLLRLQQPNILSHGAYWLTYEALLPEREPLDPTEIEIASPYTFISSGPEPGVLVDCVAIVAHALTIH